MNIKTYDVKIIGAGVAGCVLARLAANQGLTVLLTEKTSAIAGQTQESIINGHLVQQYGPHIIYGNNDKVFDFLSEYCELKHTKMTVAADVDGEYCRLPLNFHTFDDMFKSSSQEIKSFLLDNYKYGEKIRYSQIMELIAITGQTSVTMMIEHAINIIYDEFSKKLWGDKYKEIFTLDRVPIIVGYTSTYYPAKYHYLPKHGYNELFKKMISHQNITVMVNTDGNIVDIKSKSVINTGKIDEFYKYEFGKLPYRSIDFTYKYTSARLTFNSVHYPVNEKYTRVSDMSTLYDKDGKTILVIETPAAHVDGLNLPLYIIDTKENRELVNKYIYKSKDTPNILHIGRCAEYKYYTMHDLIKTCLEVDFKRLIA